MCKKGISSGLHLRHNRKDQLLSFFAMNIILIVLHPFLLILLGWWLRYRAYFSKSWWDGCEKLVYYVLFPPMLFNSVASAFLTLTSASRFLLCGVGSMMVGVFLAYLVSKFFPQDARTDASVRQCGYRFNSYIGFALVASLYADFGTALYVLLLGVWVPISNAFAVADLSQAARAKNQTFFALLKTIVTNPLIMATLLGLCFNTMGWTLPTLISGLFKSLGSASLVLALLAIGAGMEKLSISLYGKLLSAATIERLLAVPLVSVLIGMMAGLNSVELGALLCFTALPTANSCYILAVRMGGNGLIVADLTTLQTVVSLITLPFWSMLVQYF